MTTPLKSDALLVVEGLGIQVGGKRLLRDIGFSLRPGEALTLVGESGAGKSLLAQAIMGNLPPALQAMGQITLDGATTRAQDAAARRALWGRKLALLPQEPSLALNPLARVAPQLAEVYRLLHQQHVLLIQLPLRQQIPRQAGGARDHRQDVVEVVRHAAAQPADRLQLLRLQQLRLQAALLGHVAPHDAHALARVGATHARGTTADHEARAICSQQLTVPQLA